jgi:hypothetical protein
MKKDEKVIPTETIEEFLARGGEIEVLPPQEFEDKRVIGSITQKTPELKTLEEAQLLYGKKHVKKRKPKEPDFSGINVDLIPEHLRHIITNQSKVDKDKTKEELLETDKNSRSTKASDKS